MMYKTETIKIADREIIIKPLTGKYFAKFMKAASKMPREEQNIADFDEDAIAAFHELAVVSISESFKDLSKDDIELIVTTNFTLLMKTVSLVNTPEE